jgi:hypothetical protein
VGGMPGYYQFLEVIADPSHEEHESMLEWCGGSFDPRRLDIEARNESLKRIKLQLSSRCSPEAYAAPASRVRTSKGPRTCRSPTAPRRTRSAISMLLPAPCLALEQAYRPGGELAEIPP